MIESDSYIGVGGLGVRLAAMARQEYVPELAAVGKAIDLRRREKGITTEKLTQLAHVTEDALDDVQRGIRMPNSRDVICLVCHVLDLPAAKLVAAAGLNGSPPDPALSSAALRLASQAKPPESLSPPEHAALDEFIGAISGTS